MPWLLKYIIDDVIQGAGSLQDKTSQLITAIELLSFFAVLRPPIEYYRQYFAQRIANTILYDLRKHIFGHLQKLSLRYYSIQKQGRLFSVSSMM